MKKFIPAIAVSALLLSTPVLAEQSTFSEGLEAYNSQDYQTALSLFEGLSAQGDVGAQYNLALMYDQGKGVKQNTAKAVEWYTEAAINGHDGAQYNLAPLYLLHRHI